MKALGFLKRRNTFTKIENGFSTILVLQSSQWHSLKRFLSPERVVAFSRIFIEEVSVSYPSILN
ncbi:hypothetical protein [Spirosoma linguale]|uniref:hypothetical protein n=1 Tax=Spirosoma linguale TaxID=108 RepID=UPI003CC8046B